MIKRIAAVFLSIIFGGIAPGTAENTIQNRIENDKTLVVPGLGAERALLHKKDDHAIHIKGYPQEVSEFKQKRELFKHVFNLESPVKIYFDKIYNYKDQNSVIFINNTIISGIIGLSNQRVTIDSIEIKKGVEYFIFSYGNAMLDVLQKSSGRKGDKIYLYKSRGIAVVDDGDNNSIDMFIVFPVQTD